MCAHLNCKWWQAACWAMKSQQHPPASKLLHNQWHYATRVRACSLHQQNQVLWETDTSSVWGHSMSPVGVVRSCRSAVCSLMEECDEVSQAHLHCYGGPVSTSSAGTYLHTRNSTLQKGHVRSSTHWRCCGDITCQLSCNTNRRQSSKLSRKTPEGAANRCSGVSRF